MIICAAIKDTRPVRSLEEFVMAAFIPRCMMQA